MDYKTTERIDGRLSVIGLGGHEYLPDGRSRGFNEASKSALKPGVVLPGFGAGTRTSILAAAYEAGITLYDATLDSEVEALGRNLREVPPPYTVFVQVRPQGMVYSYDPYNRKMADRGALEAEVLRLLKLLGRERIDFLNFGFLGSAIDHDPAYLDKIALNIEHLKQSSLIRYASADTFSGEATYLAQIERGCFDSLFINFNIADDGPAARVFQAAVDRGMSVITREAYMKGALFTMGDEAGISDRNLVARCALKWVFSHDAVTTVVVGADDAYQLRNSVSVLDDPVLSAAELDVIERIKATDAFASYAKQKRDQFG